MLFTGSAVYIHLGPGQLGLSTSLGFFDSSISRQVFGYMWLALGQLCDIVINLGKPMPQFFELLVEIKQLLFAILVHFSQQLRTSSCFCKACRDTAERKFS